MRITDSTVAVAAQRQYSQHREESLTIRIDRPVASTPPAAVPRPEVELSSQGLEASQGLDEDGESSLDPKLSLIKSLLEAMLGIRIKLGEVPRNSPTDAGAALQAPPDAADQGGVAVNYRRVFEESETTQFAAAGIVRTADGREISFSSELTLARSYREEITFGMASGSLARPKKDPLVLNFAAPAATLSAQRMAFDIDSDGQADQIATLNAGSGFLALDHNEDGVINNGRELFGAQSGDGFADLAHYDDDGNGWIDAGDGVFARLKLWLKDDSGQDQLLTLASMGVGAIYLGRAQGDFSLMDHQNAELGQIRASGIFLGEDGSVGTVQQIDLTV